MPINPPFDPRFSTEFNRALLMGAAQEAIMERRYAESWETQACHDGNHDGCGFPVKGWIECQCACHTAPKPHWWQQLWRGLRHRSTT